MGLGFLKCTECEAVIMWSTHQGYAEQGEHKPFCSKKTPMKPYDPISRKTLEDPNREPLS